VKMSIDDHDASLTKVRLKYANANSSSSYPFSHLTALFTVWLLLGRWPRSAQQLVFPF